MSLAKALVLQATVATARSSMAHAERVQADAQQRQATYLTLMGLFLALLTAFSARAKRRQNQFEIRALDLVLLAFATYRGGNLAAYDKVTQPLRKPFTETRPDASGTGKTVVPRGGGVRHALGELISCPVCSGTWIAAGLVYGLLNLPGPTRVLMTILASVGMAEWLNASTEALKWTGFFVREQSGGNA